MANYRDEEVTNTPYEVCNSRCSTCGYKVGGSCLLIQADVHSEMRVDQIAASGRPVPLHCPNNLQTPSTFREKPLQTVRVEEVQRKRTKAGKNKNKTKPSNVHFI